MPRINELTSRECLSYLQSGGDLVFVPIGAHERLGPHLPLGARAMVADAIAMRMAEKHGGLCLPMIPYATIYDTHALKGSIDIDTGLMHRYLTGLCDELTANNFRRIVFVGFHEELYYLCHEYFQHHHLAVAWIHPDRLFESGAAKPLDRHGRELWRLVACLRAIGCEDLLARVLEKTRAEFGAHSVVRNIGRENLDKLGYTGHKMQAGEWMIYPVNLGESLGQSDHFRAPDSALIEKAHAELDTWLDCFGAPLSSLSEYQNFLDANPITRPH